MKEATPLSEMTPVERRGFIKAQGGRRVYKRQMAIRFMGFNPSTMKSRQFYQTVIVAFVTISGFAMWAWATGQQWYITQAPVQQAAWVILPYVGLVVAVFALLALLWLWRNAQKLCPGELDEFPFVPGSPFESLRTFVWHDDAGHVKFRTLHAIRAGVYSPHIRLPWGPIVVAPVLNGEYDAQLLENWTRTGTWPQVPPEEWAGRLKCYITIGPKHIIPGAVRIKVFHAKWDGIEWMRPWLQRTFKISPIAPVVFLPDTLPEADRLMQAQPAIHSTNEEWLVADLEREIADLRAKLEASRLYNRKGTDIEGSTDFLPTGAGET